MAKDNKYGNIDVPGVPTDEPIFILRAQDALALPTILHYQQLAKGLGRSEDTPHAVGLRKSIANFGDFKGTRKLPD